MNISTNRLKTFTEHQPSWPYLNNKKYHNPEEFSNAGFYNVATDKVKDELKCYLCDMTLNRWKEGQSPLARHALAKPKCPLVLLNFPDALSTVSFDEANPDTYPESDYMTTARIQTFIKDKAWPPASSTPSSSSTATTTKRQTRSSTIIRQKPYPTSTEKEHDRVFCPYCHCTLSNLRGVTNSL
ncbi:hypothetical protein BJ944DRAFT_270503 [Cunninghamella echinulata]|nr:hypothetical protein BJ944DRAFT_270503 [Cunninghamella echinulata]